ncbi:MAG: glycosyltransferase family 4 protein [Pseudomonadota bacterium]
MTSPRVLILAESCNPEWPSLPVVGYKYARALMEVCDATLATHPRNRENIEATGDIPADRIRYIDTEWLAAPMYKLARRLRGGDEVAWSTNQMMAYPPYIAFERQARALLRKDSYDLVHRITPMSPTLPSYLAGRAGVPMILGPLNGNLDWPAAFAAEQKREREGLRKLRGLYRYLPYARSTYQKADAILAAFQHTIDDLDRADPARIVPVPEVGFDKALFHPGERAPAFSGPGPFTFLFAGRLVPYKVPEVAVRAFASSEALRPHRLRILGDGPERPRLEAMVAKAGAEDRITFEGRKSQAEVAQAMRAADAFVFPSIRELGAGVVIEAMASGALCVVTDYGAPGDLAANGRGVQVPLAPLEEMVGSYRAALEGCLTDPDAARTMAETARAHAFKYYTWDAKAAYTARIYDAVLTGAPLGDFTEYV